MPYVEEPERRTAVVREVDVAVAGGGIAGTIAAIAAARQGARTVLVDRFGTIGGNMVQGTWCAGGMHLALGFPDAFPNGLGGVPGEFVERLDAMRQEMGPDSSLGERACRIGYLTFQMAAEAGVLGVPFIRFNDFVDRISYLQELEENYKLGYGIKASEPSILFDRVRKLLELEGRQLLFQHRRIKMLEDKIDLSKFMVWFIENYPNSVQIMKENPDYQFNFR